MGLARAAIHLLLLEAARRPFSGTIVTLGRQHVYATADEVRVMAKRLGVLLASTEIELHREPHLASKGYISDTSLLKMLGFETIFRVDYSDYESPEATFDLNDTLTPDELQGRFDVVLDSGTIEHVFDIAAALRHCCRMVKPGGRVIHLTPSSNCVEHGFHSVSPTLFADYYTVSQFQLDRIYLCRIPLDLPRGVWNVYDYLGASQRFIPLGQLDSKIWFTYAVVTAGAGPVPGIPQQSFYVKTWKDSQQLPAGLAGEAPQAPESQGRSVNVLRRLQKWPWLHDLVASMIHQWRRLVNWYRIRTKELPYLFVGRF